MNNFKKPVEPENMRWAQQNGYKKQGNGTEFRSNYKESGRKGTGMLSGNGEREWE